MPRKSLAAVSSVLMLASIAAAAGAAGAASAVSAAVTGPALSISLTAGRHAINRDIYGMNFAPARLESQLKLPVVRWGGNATTRYNYLLDTANHASDWYFENIPNTVKNPALLPNGSSADQFIGRNQRDGADSIITVPLIGWTPKSRAQVVRIQRGQVRPAAVHRSVRLRLRQRREHQRPVHHREQPGRHQQARGRRPSSPTGSATWTASTAARPRAA